MVEGDATVNLATRLLGEIKTRRRLIVVIGDTMLDRWVHGHIEQCQDDCPKFVQESVVETPGGAANAALCLSHWDTQVSLYGFAGNDCPIKCRYMENGKIVFRHDDDGPPRCGTEYEWERKLALEMASHADAVLLSDYDKGFLTPYFIKEMAALCKARRVPCVADAKRAPEVYENCIIKGNYAWYEKFGSPHVLTLGGVEPTVGNDSIYSDDVLSPVNCINHVGAGDCFAAHLTLALAYEFTIKEAAALAHSAGRVYVQFPHNRAPSPEEVAADLALATG